VLVPMGSDRDGGERTNWLLIKHYDFSVEGNGAAVLEENAMSVACGRMMEAIAAGMGKKPKPFMIKSGGVQADAVWDSNHGLAAEERKAETKTKKKCAGQACQVDHTDFIAPQLCKTREHEIKFDGYRIQMRIENGDVTLRLARASTHLGF
jgi:bifunctional non-homologous end joining protein LigD